MKLRAIIIAGILSGALLFWLSTAHAQTGQNNIPHAGVGACVSGSVVSRLNPNAPPTCVINGGVPSGQAAWYEVGTVTNGNTGTCNFAGTWGCHMSAASAASITIGNPLNLPTKAFIVIVVTNLGNADPTVGFGTAFKGYSGITNTFTTLSNFFNGGADFFFSNGSGGSFTTTWYSDGTTLSLANPLDIEAQAVHSNQIFGHGYTSSTDGFIEPPINAIGSLNACGSAYEGSLAVATDCNAACSPGATCTTGGSTHCQVYCNGTAYKETGASVASGVTSIAGTANQIAASSSTGAVTLSLVGPYTPATYTAHVPLLGEGTSSISVAEGAGTDGQMLLGQSSVDPAWETMSGDGTLAKTGAITITKINGNTPGGSCSAGSVVTSVSSSGVPTCTQKTDKFTCGSTAVGTNSQILCDVPMTVAETVPVNCSASTATSVVAANASTTFTVKKITSAGASTTIGTVVWSASGKTGAFTCASPVSLAATDLLEIDGPATADTTLAQWGITISANAGAL
jgi:hypothetical protein